MTHNRSRILALAMVQNGVKLVAVDFDRTIVDIHTGGRFKQSATILSSHFRSFFKHFLKEAQQVGLWISVVTFSGQTQLIADAMAIALGGESSIKRCYLRGEDGGWTRPNSQDASANWQSRNLSKGKLGHIYSVVQNISKLTGEAISPSEVFYIDDDLANVDIGRQAGMLHTCWCPATYEPNSCDHILWTELEGKYLKGEKLKVMSNTADVVDATVTKKSAVCVVM